MNELYCLYRQAGFFRKTLATYLNVSPITVKRWEMSNKPPVAVVKLLHILINDLSHLGDEWAGFYFFNGELVTPESEFITPGKIRAHRFLNMSIDFLNEDNRKLKQEIERLELCTAFPKRVTF